jgi:biopolymer transport protein ExbB
LLVESPTIKDRINQGGIVGYCIIALGIIGLLIAIIRFLGLTNDSRKVTAQLKRDTASTDNPLGRVLAAYESNKGADTETIELKLSEAALKEMPGLTKGLLLIKVISVVAPLMGLLGTVTGMIKTFQVITLYGAGDPKMMAGGISQALMTTVDDRTRPGGCHSDGTASHHRQWPESQGHQHPPVAERGPRRPAFRVATLGGRSCSG